MKTAKEELIDEQCKNTERKKCEGIRPGSSKDAYKTLETHTKTQQLKSAVIEDSGGNILTEGTAVLNRWT